MDMEKQGVSLFSFNHFGFMNTQGMDVATILIFSYNRGINGFSLTLSISGNAVQCLILAMNSFFIYSIALKKT